MIRWRDGRGRGVQDQHAWSRRVVQLRPGELDFFQFAQNLTLKVADGYSVAGLLRVQAELAVDLPPRTSGRI